ncbi:hypothetical protein BY458DRAFT_37887 [Sporodiniella umbellata]|nr:hypothetical protein BY458DRAFT_37887 [Sporodiniella umbellata]
MSRMRSERIMEMEKLAQSAVPKVVLRAVLPDGHAVSIIGKKGMVAQWISKTFSVVLSIFPVYGKLVTVTGTPKQVARAWSAVLNTLAQSFPHYYSRRASISFLLPMDLTSLLKDRLEVNLSFEHIARSTGIELALKKKTAPRSTENILQLILGDTMTQLGAFERAVALLADVIQSHPHLSLSPETIYFIPLQGPNEDAIIHDTENEIVYTQH